MKPSEKQKLKLNETNGLKFKEEYLELCNKYKGVIRDSSFDESKIYFKDRSVYSIDREVMLLIKELDFHSIKGI